jgi:hypothetical protein
MTNQLSIKLLAVISVSAFACIQARAGEGIAQNAMAAEKAAQAPEVLTTPPHRVEEKQTGIKAPPGVLIHPVIQSSDVEIRPVPRVRSNQEDYHSQQNY